MTITMEVSKCHNLLLDAGLPSTIEDLKNPTEGYVTNLLIAFFSKFGINMSLIDLPFSEQLSAMPHYEDSDITNLLNLYVVVIQVVEKIFLHDFAFTDITSPGQKRLKKQAKFLSNFMLYVMHKKSECNDRMEQIQAASRQIEELKETKARILESINNKALQNAKNLSLIKKFSSDIQYMKSKTEKLNKKKSDVEIMKNKIERENQIDKELRDSLKIKAEQLSKEVTELQSEIVHSSEEYQSCLDKLEQEKNLKEKERAMMQEAINEKKETIKQTGEKMNFIQKMNDELSLLKNTFKELKDKKMTTDNLKCKIEPLNNDLCTLQTKLAVLKKQMDTEMNELQSHRKENISPLYNLHNQQLSEKKANKTKLDANQACFNEKCLKKGQLHTDIMKIEEEITFLLRSSQEMYDNEVANELELRKAIENKIENNEE